MAKATKAQKQTALAALAGDPTGSSLAKAGIEVKLTKSEIAEYISAKAMQKIESEIDTLNKRQSALCNESGRVENYPKRFKPVITALNDVADNHTYEVHQQGNFEHFTDIFHAKWKVVRVGQREDGTKWTETVLHYAVKEGDTVTPRLKEWSENYLRLRELAKKKTILAQKNYKVLMVESILSGSVAGTTVLTDLHKMVDDMVGAPTPVEDVNCAIYIDGSSD